MMNDIEINVKKVFESLKAFQKESKATFSVYGPIAPFLLLSTLQTAVNRQVGYPEYSAQLLNVSKGLFRPVPVLKIEDTEPIIARVSEEIGDTSYSLRNLFFTSIQAFDIIAKKAKELTTHLDGFADLDFERNSKEIFETAISMAEKAFYGGNTVSNPSIAMLAKRILNVRPGESFTDFVCGLGLSASLITGDVDDVKISLSDIDSNSYAFACVGCFLKGCKNYGKVEDSLSETHFYEGMKSDNIFIDPPLRVRITNPFEVNGINIKETSCSAIMKALHLLNENGKAVIAINTGFTYGTQYEMAATRKYLVDNNYVSAIINFPPMWSSAGALTTLLVLSKTENKTITMIDFARKSNDSRLFNYNRVFQVNTLTENAQNMIISLLEDNSDIPELCSKVTKEDIVSKNYSLLPGVYLEETKVEKMSVDEIDMKINTTLAEIKALISQL